MIAPSDGPNLVYGETVSRNEFGIDAGWYMSPDSSKVAFYRKDQNKVTWFPLLDIDTRTGELKQIKYPMNGMDSEEVAVGVYDFASGKTVYLEVNDFTTERYITNISWSPDSRSLYAQILDRSQHHAKLNQYSAATGNFVRTLLTEDNEAWVEPLNPIYFIKGRTDLFLYRTDNRDGFRNLYLVDTLGTLRRLPTASADIDYVDNDGTNVYYTSAENSPVQNHLYKMQLKLPGKNAVNKAKFYKPVQLTSGRGWHHVQLTPDCKWFLDAWSNTSTPYQVYRRSTDGKVNEKVHEADDPLKGYASCQVELGTVPSADGQFRNYYRLIYPKNFDPAKNTPSSSMSMAARTARWYRTAGWDKSACGKCSWHKKATWCTCRTTAARRTAAPPSKKPSTGSAARPKWKTRWWELTGSRASPMSMPPALAYTAGATAGS